MIHGITILNKIAITGLPLWLMITWTVIIIISVGITVVGGLITECNIKVVTTAGIIAIVAFFAGCILNYTVKTGEYRYECLIDDSAIFNDVVERYEIVEQRGDIWVLEDKS